MLVSHPNETEAGFQRLYDFIEEGTIDHLGMFPWSRGGARRRRRCCPRRVDPELAEERRAALMELQEEIRQARHEAMIDTTLGSSSTASATRQFLLDARHEGQAPDRRQGHPRRRRRRAGSFVRCRVTQSGRHGLVATLEL